MAKVTKEMINELYETILKIKDIDECRVFFDDLCTKKEIENMAQRVQAARLLKEGLTYNQVIEKTGISSATLSRISTCVKYGEGYNSVIRENMTDISLNEGENK